MTSTPTVSGTAVRALPAYVKKVKNTSARGCHSNCDLEHGQSLLFVGQGSPDSQQCSNGLHVLAECSLRHSNSVEESPGHSIDSAGHSSFGDRSPELEK